MEKFFELPNGAHLIIEKLEQAGFSTYIVGGCVRDMIMHRAPNDWDITTSALPDDIKKIFKRTYDTGIAHGTVTVIINDEHYEVTTYRTEKEYTDFRRPSGVDFVQDINEDLSRRDFTMNAIAYHPIRGFVDPYDGITDIESKIICCVGDANKRFSEDALRILRAVRFAAQINFEIELNTKEALINKKDLLQHISKERIRDEFNKICLSQNPYFILNIYEWGILNFISQDIKNLFDTLEQSQKELSIIKPLKDMPNNLVSKYTALLYLTRDYELAKRILKQLKFDNKTIKNVALSIKYFNEEPTNTIDIKKLLRACGVENVKNILFLKEILCKNEEEREQIKNLFLLIEQIVKTKECYTLEDLAINGHDLLNLNVKSGKDIALKLEQALEFVLNNPTKNTKEDILNFLSAYI
ncbi:hypothetical protein AN642_03000 [Epulopiscium sp. SCG-B10WGA-EpuloA2]|nr:hypothetical protein AN642_03000 [Epulopiscium sp. SCG-B10WGA-EpuloA2]